MEQKSYHLQRYSKDYVYSGFSNGLIEKSIMPSNNMQISFKEVSNLNYSTLILPKTSLGDLINLLEYFNLTEYQEDFLYLIAITQSSFILYNTKFEGELYKDFYKEKKDLEKMIDALQIYLFEDRRELHSISLKFLSIDSITINNFFLLDDIYKSILAYYSINKDNIHDRRKELLDEYTNSFNFKRGGDFVKAQMVKLVFNFIKATAVDFSENTLLSFCGVFLHICQIPSNNNSDDIEIDEIRDALAVIDHQNLRHYVNDRPRFYY